MSYLDRDLDVMRYQGQAFNWIGFDELMGDTLRLGLYAFTT